jgi:hypothetical protein
MSRSEAACVGTICLALLVPAAASAAPMLTDVDQSVIERHRALGRLNESADQGSELDYLQVSLDRAAIRRHQALGRLPEVLTTSASRARGLDETTAFDWRDGAIGFAVGVGTLGFVLVLDRLRHRSAAALRKASP